MNDPAAKPKAEVRPMFGGQAALIGEYLHRELNPAIDAQTYARAFAMAGDWSGGELPVGYGLFERDRLSGFLGALNHVREVGGKAVRWCNLTTWQVAPHLRSRSTSLLFRAMRDLEDGIVTDLTPTATVQKILVAVGFKVMDMEAVIVARPQAPPPGEDGPRLVADESEALAFLDERERRFWRDHSRAGCLCRVGVDDRGACLLIARRRVENAVVEVELLYAGDDGFLARNLSGVVSGLCWEARAMAFSADRRLLPEVDPRLSLVRPVRRFFKTKVQGLERLDNLYTEFTVLPV